MTNIDRAADIIWRQSDAAQGGDAAAQALAAAGLLAPDPVEPYAEGMTSGPRGIGDIDHPECRFALFSVPGHPDAAAAYGDRVEITHTIVPDRRCYTPAQARDLALALLSAAAYAEEHTDDQ